MSPKGPFMETQDRIRMAIQKSGRLHDKSIALLDRCGLNFEWAKDRLFCRCENFPLDLMLLRDDDIPEYISDGVCDLGIVGLNVLEEKLLGRHDKPQDGVTVLKKLGFGHCRLSIAIPTEQEFTGLQFLSGLKVATSYPRSFSRFLRQNDIQADVVEISGSVEVAPALKIADAICDLVSTGTTLRSNGLKEVLTILKSESVFVQSKKAISPEKSSEIDRLLRRIEGVMKAAQAKYIMMNAPRTAIEGICALLPGMEAPTIIPLGSDDSLVAIHAVAQEAVFWETMEGLKRAGASSILVMPIEKIIE